MKKIAYMISALSLALFAKSASADISVSTGSVAYTDAGGNTSTTMVAVYHLQCLQQLMVV